MDTGVAVCLIIRIQPVSAEFLRRELRHPANRRGALRHGETADNAVHIALNAGNDGNMIAAQQHIAQLQIFQIGGIHRCHTGNGSPLAAGETHGKMQHICSEGGADRAVEIEHRAAFSVLRAGIHHAAGIGNSGKIRLKQHVVAHEFLITAHRGIGDALLGTVLPREHVNIHTLIVLIPDYHTGRESCHRGPFQLSHLFGALERIFHAL